jgi:hypothetical protein
MRFTHVHIAVAVAEPTEVPREDQSDSNAITEARSSWGTDAWEPTREPTTLKAPPIPIRIWVQT